MGEPPGLSPESSPKNNQVDDVLDTLIETAIVDNADVAGGIAADDAAAGDAAVLALIARKCAPAASPELQQLPDKVDLVLGNVSGPPDCSPVSSSSSRAQFFNLWEADVENVEAEKVQQWLKKLGLGRYFEQLAAEGFDDMSILASVEEKQIDDLIEMCPMPMLHEQQLRRGLARLRSGNTSEDVPELPLAECV